MTPTNTRRRALVVNASSLLTAAALHTAVLAALATVSMTLPPRDDELPTAFAVSILHDDEWTVIERVPSSEPDQEPSQPAEPPPSAPKDPEPTPAPDLLAESTPPAPAEPEPEPPPAATELLAAGRAVPVDQDAAVAKDPIPPSDAAPPALAPVAAVPAPAGGSTSIAVAASSTGPAPAAKPVEAGAATLPELVGEAATTYAPAPVYPRRAIDLRLEGQAVFIAFVRATGVVDRCELESSSGHDLLDESARKTLLTWRFKPHLADGRSARPFRARVPFHFTIPKPGPKPRARP